MHAQNKTPDSTLQPEIINKPKKCGVVSEIWVNEKSTDCTTSRKSGCEENIGRSKTTQIPPLTVPYIYGEGVYA